MEKSEVLNGKRDRLASWLAGDGIEIGALHRPLRLPEGARVTYVDRLTVEQLREHYPELSEWNLTPVDVIGSADDLSAFTDASLDFVVANHLLEHLEYPLDGLNEFWRVLRPGGLLFMALPDKRVTFDRTRSLTPTEHVLEEQRTRAAGSGRRGHFVDYAQHVDGKASGPEAERHADRLMERDYSIHFHVWTPDSFLDLLVAARQELGLAFQLLGFAAPEHAGDDEFILLLAKPDGDRVRLPPEQPPSAVPPPPTPTLRRRLARSPAGPPVRAAKRVLTRLRGSKS